MDQDQLKRLVAEAARDAVLALDPGQVLGIGTGSTANWFIDVLAPHKAHFSGVVSSSVASTQRLLKHGFYVIDANQVETLPAYVDGADEINPQRSYDQGRRRGANPREDCGIACKTVHLHLRRFKAGSYFRSLSIAAGSDSIGRSVGI
jgi:hypothetical protein